ncbi:MAG TPA: polyhydroxyalkanoic acid synthase [Arenimonas sp.]|nr:MAG: polyhydroxyalkanoic acid synthase [Xanthomonadales bacterium GWF1_69_6]HBD19730.1 polyhydroxyalkanoic acid synthase [Arenimonas sp.]
MSHIDIRRKHTRSIKDARAAIERVAEHLAEKFDVEYGWDGDTMEFSRGGVDGHIALSAKEVHVTAQLGFLLGAIKGPIEREIHQYLDREFG